MCGKDISDYVAGCPCRFNSMGYTLATMDDVLSDKTQC